MNILLTVQYFRPIRLDDVYLCLFPFGFMGLHYIFLQQYAFAAVFAATLGFLGIGWIIDFVQMPALVRRLNHECPKLAIEPLIPDLFYIVRRPPPIIPNLGNLLQPASASTTTSKGAIKALHLSYC
jgi:TM2 domain-containing membrane protein YozV